MWRIGVDLGGTKIEALALSPDGAERSRIRVPTPRGDYGATLDAIVSLAGTCRDGLADQDIAGIGIGVPGSLSPKTGLVRNANSTWLNGRPLLHDLEARFPWPVAIENDANCFALSEAADGAGQGCGTVFGVILGTGVGGGIVHSGKPLLGHNAVAGEWGHNPLPWPDADEWPGPPCYCGKRGCIETFLSGPALERQYQGACGAGGSSEGHSGARESRRGRGAIRAGNLCEETCEVTGHGSQRRRSGCDCVRGRRIEHRRHQGHDDFRTPRLGVLRLFRYAARSQQMGGLRRGQGGRSPDNPQVTRQSRVTCGSMRLQHHLVLKV